MLEMINGNPTEIRILLTDFDADGRFDWSEGKKCLHEFLSGAWQPNYDHWVAEMRDWYPALLTEAEKKAKEAKIDSEARAYQAQWEKQHGRPWPS